MVLKCSRRNLLDFSLRRFITRLVANRHLLTAIRRLVRGKGEGLGWRRERGTEGKRESEEEEKEERIR